MDRLSAEHPHQTRVAVIGAATPEGSHLREALAAAGLAGEQVNLYGATTGEAVLTEYAGGARLIQEPNLVEIVAHDVIFLCDSSEVSRRVPSLVGEAIVLDLVGSVAESRLIHPEINPHDAPTLHGCLSIPHPLSSVLAELLLPVEQSFGLEEVLGIVLRPAADFGQEGLDELRDQTVRLLSFAEVPKKIFGAQLAFNTLIEERTAAAQPGTASRVVGEVARLLGWPSQRLSLRLITAPVFYGHGLQLRLRLRRSASRAELEARLIEVGLWDPAGSERAASPLEAAGESRVILSELDEDGLGGYWIWAVVGETHAIAARQAVALAVSLRGL